MSRLTIANGGRVAYAWVDDADFEEIGALPEEAESLPDAVRVVEGVDVAILLRQAGGEVRGNLRSKTGFDVSAVAQHFGGGGHRAASGFTFSGTIEQTHPATPCAHARRRERVSARRGATELSGILAIDKPQGMTSHDVVNRYAA